MMKRTVILLVIALATLPLAAQQEEEHVVRRGRYKAAVTTTVTVEQKHWFSNLSVGVLYGHYNVADCNTDFTVYGMTQKDMETLEDHIGRFTNADETVFTGSYEFLYRLGTLYVGPAATVMVGKKFAPGLYLRAHYELGTWAATPYISAAGGFYLMPDGDPYTNTYDAYYKKRTYSYSSPRVYFYDGFTNGKHADVEGGLKPYLDFGAGISVKLHDNGMKLVIGYQAVLRPSVHISFDINKYEGEINGYVRNLSTPYGQYRTYEKRWSYPVEVEYTSLLYHGIKMSFVF